MFPLREPQRADYESSRRHAKNTKPTSRSLEAQRDHQPQCLCVLLGILPAPGTRALAPGWCRNRLKRLPEQRRRLPGALAELPPQGSNAIRMNTCQSFIPSGHMPPSVPADLRREPMYSLSRRNRRRRRPVRAYKASAKQRCSFVIFHQRLSRIQGSDVGVHAGRRLLAQLLHRKRLAISGAARFTQLRTAVQCKCAPGRTPFSSKNLVTYK